MINNNNNNNNNNINNNNNNNYNNNKNKKNSRDFEKVLEHQMLTKSQITKFFGKSSNLFFLRRENSQTK